MHALNQVFKEANSYNPFEIASYLGIDIVYKDTLPDHYNGLAVYELNCIFINPKITGDIELLTVCAHELTHIICHNGYTEFLRLIKRNENTNGKRSKLWCLVYP